MDFFKERIGELVLRQQWDQNVCRLSLVNPTGRSVKLKEVEIYSGVMNFAPDTPCCGEGYNKLSQYAGTVADCRMSGSLGDYEHYRLPGQENGAQIQKNHPRLEAGEIPTGWCSWLVYGPDVAAADIYDNLNEINCKELGLRYIQIDDGYQRYIGDWLYPADRFQSGIEELCAQIRRKGLEPGIWVAPFIAEKDSLLLREHPDWFVMDEDGQPLPSDRVTFGGWRNGPWYMLDGTNPAACAYLTEVFRVMRTQWKIRYFKLDANMWGGSALWDKA